MIYFIHDNNKTPWVKCTFSDDMIKYSSIAIALGFNYHLNVLSYKDTWQNSCSACILINSVSSKCILKKLYENEIASGHLMTFGFKNKYFFLSTGRAKMYNKIWPTFINICHFLPWVKICGFVEKEIFLVGI